MKLDAWNVVDVVNIMDTDLKKHYVIVVMVTDGCSVCIAITYASINNMYTPF